MAAEFQILRSEQVAEPLPVITSRGVESTTVTRHREQFVGSPFSPAACRRYHEVRTIGGVQYGYLNEFTLAEEGAR